MNFEILEMKIRSIFRSQSRCKDKRTEFKSNEDASRRDKKMESSVRIKNVFNRKLFGNKNMIPSAATLFYVKVVCLME